MTQFTQDFRTQRRNYADGNTRIGETGRLWYDSITNTIRISDGVTPGGIIVSSATGGGGSSTILSVYTASPGTASLSYNNLNGVFTYTPPDLTSYAQTSALATVALSGSYLNLTNKPSIPNDITDLGITDGTSGQVLTTDGSGNFSFTTVTSGSGSTTLSELTDTSLSSLITGQSLVWNGAYWTNQTVSGSGSTTLSSLTDTTLVSPTSGQALVFNGSVWTNQTISGGGSTTLDGLTDVTVGGPIAGQFLQYNGSQWANTTIDLTDLGITDGSTGQVLATDGAGNFYFTSIAGSATYSYNDLTDKPVIPETLTDLNITDGSNGQVLSTDGSGNFTFVTLSTGSGSSTNAIQWEVAGDQDQYRVSSQFVGADSITYDIRSARINSDNLLELELANFNPTVLATGQTSLYWDQPASQFTVTVINPDDFTTRWLDEVDSITNIAGVHTTVSDYTTTGKSATPGPGVDWIQTFTTNTTATITSNGSGLSGGSAGGIISFNDNNNAVWGTQASMSFLWRSASMSASFGNLSGKTFLNYYNSVPYYVSISGLLNPSSNAVTTVSGAGGTASNNTGSGTFTFTDPIHKDNNSGISLTVSTTFTRPASITGTSYTATANSSDTTISTSFTYPSFYYWTADTSTPPTRADIVTGYDFDSAVTQLGNQTKNIDATVTNSSGGPMAFWFAVRSSATQPTTFKTGPDSSLLSDVSVTTGNSLSLEPDVPLSGYIAEGYTLYGITLQSGNTYVRIN